MGLGGNFDQMNAFGREFVGKSVAQASGNGVEYAFAFATQKIPVAVAEGFHRHLGGVAVKHRFRFQGCQRVKGLGGLFLGRLVHEFLGDNDFVLQNKDRPVFMEMMLGNAVVDKMDQDGYVCEQTLLAQLLGKIKDSGLGQFKFSKSKSSLHQAQVFLGQFNQQDAQDDGSPRFTNWSRERLMKGIIQQKPDYIGLLLYRKENFLNWLRGQAQLRRRQRGSNHILSLLFR